MRLAITLFMLFFVGAGSKPTEECSVTFYGELDLPSGTVVVRYGTEHWPGVSTHVIAPTSLRGDYKVSPRNEGDFFVDGSLWMKKGYSCYGYYGYGEVILEARGSYGTLIYD